MSVWIGGATSHNVSERPLMSAMYTSSSVYDVRNPVANWNGDRCT